MNHDQAIEQEIQAKGKTAPRVTPQALADNIAETHYFTAAEGLVGVVVVDEAKRNNGNVDDLHFEIGDDSPLNLLTFCVLVLRNGFTVTGESACASPENFDAEIGRKAALENAKQKMWPLMGYALKQQLHEQATLAPEPLPGSDLPPHQQRVVVEYAELADKVKKLTAFTVTPMFDRLEPDEQGRLRTQLVAMRTYGDILGERIAAF